MFAKEIGVPLALLLDPSGEQSSNKVKQFCDDIAPFGGKYPMSHLCRIVYRPYQGKCTKGHARIR